MYDLELDSIYENIYEYYINDYIIFEGILRRDYMECIGILNEDGEGNFLEKLWDNIIKLIENAKYKITEFINKIVNDSYDKKIEKYKKYFEDNKELINKTDFTEFGYVYKYIKILDKDGDKSNLTVYFEFIEKKCNIDNINFIKKDTIDEQLKDIERNKSTDGKYIKGTLDEDIVTNKAYDKDDIIKCIDDIESAAKNIKLLNTIKSKLIKSTDNMKKQAEQLKRESKKNKNEEDIKYAKKVQKLVSLKLRHNLIIVKNIYKLYKFNVQENIKLLTAAVKYAKAQEKSSNKEDSQNASYIDYDMDYINALSESAIYELDI